MSTASRRNKVLADSLIIGPKFGQPSLCKTLAGRPSVWKMNDEFGLTLLRMGGQLRGFSGGRVAKLAPNGGLSVALARYIGGLQIGGTT
jgi:hypothetical protein